MTSDVELQVERLETADLGATREEILALCRSAYGEDLVDYLANIGPGSHLLGRVGSRLVSHAMWVERVLYPAGLTLRSAYIELVATLPEAQRRGYASVLMRRAADAIRDFDIGALGPSDPAYYERLGWELWRGPHFVRTPQGVVETPGDRIMVLRLPRTPASLNLDASIAVDWRPGDVW